MGRRGGKCQPGERGREENRGLRRLAPGVPQTPARPSLTLHGGWRPGDAQGASLPLFNPASRTCSSPHSAAGSRVGPKSPGAARLCSVASEVQGCKVACARPQARVPDSWSSGDHGKRGASKRHVFKSRNPFSKR